MICRLPVDWLDVIESVRQHPSLSVFSDGVVDATQFVRAIPPEDRAYAKVVNHWDHKNITAVRQERHTSQTRLGEIDPHRAMGKSK